MSKYVTVKTGTIITQVAKETDIKCYTEGILECFLPDEKVTLNWTNKQSDEWINKNNKRMTAICKFLNENNL